MVIYTKDVQRIIGKSDRTARKLMNAIRKKLGKEKNQMITLGQFCDHTRLPEEEVLKKLANPTHER
jgi:hypothetical protein